MCAVMFDRRNILPSLSNEHIKVVDFLNEKAAVGEFEFSDSVFYWKDNETIIKPLGLRHNGGGYYFAETLAYIANIEDGDIVFSEYDNAWRWIWYVSFYFWSSGMESRLCEAGYSVLCRDFMSHYFYDRKTV